jgi:hypothetical protein
VVSNIHKAEKVPGSYAKMTVDAAYTALSGRITAEVVKHETDNWPLYFEGLRDVTRRVVAETDESGLSADEKNRAS